MTEGFNRPPGVHPEWIVCDTEGRSLRLPPERPQLATFEGHLKQLSLGGLSHQLLGLLYAAFPGFMQTTVDPPPSAFRLQSESGFDIDACDYVRRRRRYSGPYLPGARYYAVSHDSNGDDGGTLLRELSAYADPIKGGVVFDAVDSIGGIGFEGRHVPPERSITLRLLIPTGPCRRANPQILKAWSEVFGQPEMPDANLSLVVSLPYTVERRKVENVLDLREIEAQDWLLQSFALADHDFLKKDHRTSVDAFHQLLPVLLAQPLGGNIVTDAIGSYLRWLGAGGLVFPSARRDSFVSYRNGRVEDFIGWNFVDFTGAALSVPYIFNDLSSGWDCEAPATCTLEIIEAGVHRRSWRLNGMSEHTARVLHEKFRAFVGTTELGLNLT